MTPSGPGSAHHRELAGSREATGCEVPVAAEAPRPALRSLNPSRGARDDDEAGKVRRARQKAAWHAQCSRLWVFSEVAQTLLGRRVYSVEGSPATARCSSRPRRIRAPRPARSGPAPPARPLRTLSQSLSVDPLSFLFVCLSSTGAPARCKVLSRPGERHPRDGEEKPKSALRRSASLPGRQTPRASPE